MRSGETAGENRRYRDSGSAILLSAPGFPGLPMGVRGQRSAPVHWQRDGVAAPDFGAGCVAGCSASAAQNPRHNPGHY